VEEVGVVGGVQGSGYRVASVDDIVIGVEAEVEIACAAELAIAHGNAKPGGADVGAVVRNLLVAADGAMIVGAAKALSRCTLDRRSAAGAIGCCASAASTIALEAIVTAAIEGADVVCAYCIGVAVVNTASTLVDVAARRAVPFESINAAAREAAVSVRTLGIGGAVVGAVGALVNVDTTIDRSLEPGNTFDVGVGLSFIR